MRIADDTPLLYLLSYSMDGEQGNDLLYCVIMDVVSAYAQQCSMCWLIIACDYELCI